MSVFAFLNIKTVSLFVMAHIWVDILRNFYKLKGFITVKDESMGDENRSLFEAFINMYITLLYWQSKMFVSAR
jgi:hypothetical protein